MNRALTLFMLAALALAACDGPPMIPREDASTPEPDGGTPEVDSGPLPTVDGGTDAGPPPAALVRFVHVAPGTPSVSFRASGHLVAPDVYYRAATPYRRVATGEGSLSAVDDDGATLAESASEDFEDGARYVAVLVDPADADPTITIARETDPTVTDPLAVRVLNATDGATLDVDLDGSLRAIEVDDLAAGAWSDWIGLAEGVALRPVVASDAVGTEPFSIAEAVQPWVAEATRALVVVAGRPLDALPSETEGLSIVLVLDATAEASPSFILRPDPRLGILQASPRLATSHVYADPSSGGDRTEIVPAIAYGDFVEAIVPPGRSFVNFVPEGELWGPQVNVDLLPGHRYFMVTRGDPASWGDDRFGAEVVRDAIEGDRFVVIHASPDAPTVRWYAETAPSTYTALDQIAPMPYAERTAARGVALDPAQRLAIAREDRTEPNVWFEVPRSSPARGFVVLAGSYLADASLPQAITTFWVDAPARGAWSATRTTTLPGSGPLPDEIPPPPG